MERHRSLIACVITAYSVIAYINARVVYLSSGADGVDLRLCACVNDTHVYTSCLVYVLHATAFAFQARFSMYRGGVNRVIFLNSTL